MQKDYKQWHAIKTKLESQEGGRRFHEREIWWCSVGENIGFEQDGKNEHFERPVLILKKFSHDVFLGIPMTSKLKDHPLYFPYCLSGENGAFILSQARLLSAKRLQRKMSTMKEFSHNRIKEQFIKILQ